MTDKSFNFVVLFIAIMTKAERTRQFIIEKAAPIFNTKGVAGTAMSDIMEATKLAKGSLYVHFENKEDLSYCTVDYIFSQLKTKISASIINKKTAKEKLFAILNFYCNSSNPAVEGGCPMLNFGMEADDTNPVILNKVNKAMEKFQEMLITIIKDGINAGEFNADWDPKKFALKAFAMIEGGIMISRISCKNDQLKTIALILKEEIKKESN